jgi:hypothetical protein
VSGSSGMFCVLLSWYNFQIIFIIFGVMYCDIFGGEVEDVSVYESGINTSVPQVESVDLDFKQFC